MSLLISEIIREAPTQLEDGPIQWSFTMTQDIAAEMIVKLERAQSSTQTKLEHGHI